MKRIEETSYVISRVVREISSLLPSRIESAFLSKDRYINLITENFILKVKCDQQNPLIFLSKTKNEKSKSNFNDSLASFVKGMRILSAEQEGNDRIVKTALSKERIIYFELIPAKFNVIITEAGRVIGLYSYKKNSKGSLILNIGDEYSANPRMGSMEEALSSAERNLILTQESIPTGGELFLQTDMKRYYVFFKESLKMQRIAVSTSASELIEKAISESENEEDEKSEAKRRFSLESKVASLKRKLAELKEEREIEKEAEELKEKAETLKANLYRAGEENLFESVSSPGKFIEYDFRSEGKPVDALKKIFGKYREMKNLSENTGAIRKKIEGEIDKLLIEIEEKKNEKGHSEDSGDEEEKGRIFFSPNNFKVISGRNASENDELTMKRAKKDDLFFHAREAKGSHVILKTKGGKPEKEDIAFAASIAAYYSAGKHSNLVCVSYTERKNISKRRNSPKGEVIMLKEKTIFVRPTSGRK
ncbi:MAG: NFACT RNA binding domain-containing protein [bacterium]|nr:NFACT RNA binding domain-containing protein [bacterium]